MHFDLRKAFNHYEFGFAQPWMLKSYKVDPALFFFLLFLQIDFFFFTSKE
jgi:hypothetical protein